MPVIFDRAEITLWPTKIRLPLNGSGAELLRAAAEDGARLRLALRRIDKAGGGDDDAATLVDGVAV
jgi:Flp pilus assembly protein CpaB